MNKSFSYLMFICLFLSCHKNIETRTENQIDSSLRDAKKYLRTQISLLEYERLNWDKARLYKKGDKIYIIAVPENGNLQQKEVYIFFKDGKISGNWVFYEFRSNGYNKYKKIISEAFDHKRMGIADVDEFGILTEINIVEHGNISKKVFSISGRTNALIVQVIVFSTDYDPNTLLLAQILGIGQPGWYVALGNPDYYNYFEYIDPENGGGNSLIIDEVEIDDSESEPSEDIVKIFNCFNQIPDAGATFSIKLCSDVPMNNHPRALLDYTGSPGHTFLVLTKSNGANSVTKSFGFYPTSGKKSLGLEPISSKIVNDKEHEINASIEMNALSLASFNTIKTWSIALANSDYDLDNFNCTDYALLIFNSIRGNNPIVLDPVAFIIQGPALQPPVPVLIPNTPQMLYKELDEMKQNNSPDAPNIILQTDRNYKSPNTTGGCN